jgi:hypothetical protein
MRQLRPATNAALFINWFSLGMGCGAFWEDKAKREEDLVIGMTHCVATICDGQF